MNKFKMAATALIASIVAALIVVLALLVYYVHESWIIALVAIVIVLIDTCYGIYIINSKRHTYTKASWLFCITMLPLLGCFFFTVFGTLPMNRHDWAEENLNHAKFNKFEKFDYAKQYFKQNPSNTNMFRYAYRNELKPVYRNNSIRALNSNTQMFSETIRLIKSAKHFIHFETYILHDGFFLRAVLAELIKKAREGVEVRLLYDWLGTFRRLKKRQIKELKQNGVEVGIFNPPGFNVFKGATNYRLHRKALIVDNKYALYGGSNIGDEYLSMDPSKNYWRDQNFVIEGEIVNSFNITFIGDWINFTDYTISHTQRQTVLDSLKKYLTIHKVKDTNDMQFCSSTPNYSEKGIMNAMASLMFRAKKSIKLVTPYFVPTELCTSAIHIAARSGVNVEIIVPGKPDNKNFIVIMNRGQYMDFIKNNCKIYEYDGFIHSKYLIIDDQHVFITTANFDYRSFWNNFESGVLIESSSFNKQMKAVFRDDLVNSKHITLTKSCEFMTFTTKFRLMLYNLYKPLL